MVKKTSKFNKTLNNITSENNNKSRYELRSNYSKPSIFSNISFSKISKKSTAQKKKEVNISLSENLKKVKNSDNFKTDNYCDDFFKNRLKNCIKVINSLFYAKF